MIKHNVRSCILSAILASCSLVPSYDRPSPPTPASHPGVTGTQVSVDIEQHFWRDFFADPRLHELINQAIENNRDLRIATQRVEEARALYGIQRADQLPSISAGALFSRSLLGASDTHFVMLAQAILYRGAGLEVVWRQFAALTVIGTVLFSLSLARFRKTLGTMAWGELKCNLQVNKVYGQGRRLS